MLIVVTIYFQGIMKKDNLQVSGISQMVLE